MKKFKSYCFFFLLPARHHLKIVLMAGGLTACCLLVFFISCRKEIKPFWDVDILAPLIKSTLSINNIIPDSLLQQNPDNSLDIVYNTSLSSFTVDSLFKIRDTTLSGYIPWLAVTDTFNPGDSIYPLFSNNIKNNLGSVELHSAIIRSGKVLLTIQSGIHGLIDFNYKIPSAKNAAGYPFDITITIPAAIGTVSGVYSGTFDLSGYKIDLTGPKGTSANTIMTSYSVRITPDAKGGYTTIINPGETIQILNKFMGIVPQYVKGYFGHTVTNTTSSSDFSLFNHIIDGTLNLKDIDIDFSIENSIGTDVQVTIDTLSSINTRTGTTVSLKHPIIGSPININRAVDNNGNVTPSLYKFSIKPLSPSNILPFIQNFPDKMRYKMNLEINPRGNLSGSSDFIYYDKLIKAQLNMTIPLWLIANNLTLADTVDFKMDATTDNVNYGKLYLYADNGFPFTAEAQLYLMDADFNIVDSLINAPNMILAPPLDANLICAGKRLTILTIPFDEDKLQLLRETKKMYIKMKYNTAGKPNYVKIYSFYEMNIKLVGDFNYTVGKKD